jgi:hypothetical protein
LAGEDCPAERAMPVAQVLGEQEVQLQRGAVHIPFSIQRNRTVESAHKNRVTRGEPKKGITFDLVYIESN